LDTVSQRRTFKFTSPSQVTNFKFFLIVGADWPAPAQTSWSVFYNATTDSAPDSVSGRTAHAKPIWRRATQTTGFGNYSFGTDSWSPAGYVLNLSGSEDYYVYRRDSLADTTNAYMQVKAKVNGSTTSPEAVFGFLDGVRMVTVGMRSGQVGFVSVPRRFFGIFPVATFIGTPLTVDSTKSHTYTLHKFKADSVVLDVDAVRSSKLLYTALPLLANQIFTFTIGPAEFFGGGSFSGSSNATWTSVTYGIGDHL
jgi:hypothetical protein